MEKERKAEEKFERPDEVTCPKSARNHLAE
jgi:hypothetical protein